MSTPLAGLDRSQVATTERRIGRKPRKFRDQFESMLCPEKPFYNNGLSLAVQAVCCEPVSGAEAAISLLNREKTGNFRELARESPIHMV